MIGAAIRAAASLVLSAQAGLLPGPVGAPTPLPLANPLVAEGDEHYRRRDEGRAGARASDREISLAIFAYDSAAQSPENVQARWKLARALYFKGTYTGLDLDARRAVYDRARRASEDAIAILARRASARPPARPAQTFADLSTSEKVSRLASDPDAAPTYFWAAVAWGEWALTVGKFTAAKTGAADKIRDDSLLVIALDPSLESGGGYRVLGRLHDQAPKIPFFTGWVSRSEALRNLREAMRIDSENVINRHFLAEALAKGNASERAEAIRLEESVLAQAPSPGRLVEELFIQEEARRNLESWTGGKKTR